MPAPTVLGTSVIVGFVSGQAITGMIRSSQGKETTADIEYVRNEDNEEAAAIVSNQGVRLTFEGTATADLDVKKGDTMNLGSVKYMIENAAISRSATTARVSLTLYKPDGLTLA